MAHQADYNLLHSYISTLQRGLGHPSQYQYEQQQYSQHEHQVQQPHILHVPAPVTVQPNLMDMNESHNLGQLNENENELLLVEDVNHVECPEDPNVINVRAQVHGTQDGGDEDVGDEVAQA
jgi:hypothetical protein